MSSKSKPWRQRDQHRGDKKIVGLHGRDPDKKIVGLRGKSESQKIIGLRIDDDFMEADNAVHHNPNWDHRDERQAE